jgi:CRP-like cAMP-binding protein
MDWGMALVKSTSAARGRDGNPAADGGSPLTASDEQQSLVVIATDSDAIAGSARGTPAYMAPEQIFGLVDEIDERTDVFGLGGILCEILLGEPPNNQRTLAGVGTPGVDRESPTDSRLWAQLPPELARIARKALAPKRENRHRSVAALRDDLEQFLQGGGWLETRDFEDGEAIVAEGEAGDTAYIVESGSCDVFKLIGGQRTRLRRLGPGDVFGEMAIFTGGIRTASVIAAGPVTVKVITGTSLTQELDQNPWISAFVRSLARLVRDSEAREERASQVPPQPPAPRGAGPARD